MRIRRQLDRLDRKVGVRAGRRPDESRRDYFARMAERGIATAVPNEIYAELVYLHDRIERLEAEVRAGRNE